MSNLQLTMIAVAALLAHLLALGVAIWRRRTRPAFGLNILVAGLTLLILVQDLRWLTAPVDLQVAGLAAVEALALVLSALALRGRYRAAMVGAWVGFALNFLASGLAVLFVFAFKITRLI
ncbi:hypothetical protein [Phenylobacterium sp.]|uniref:hypothetical protein n=1 Tax=Phenylobacterium sp. TaxID=1871053 RepID=UPI0035657552